MKITAFNRVNRQNIKNHIIAATESAASVMGILRKNNPKTTYDKDLGILGKASAAELQAAQNITKIQGLKITPNKRIYILSGSSGVGKDTILKEFLSKHTDYKQSVSHTTRKQRPGEINGVDYYFINDEMFQKGIENGDFLEWANFSGNKYGTQISTFTEMLKHTDNLILKLDVKGALKIKKLIPQAQLIFVAPPSIKELEARLKGRNTETEEAIQRRLSVVKQEMKNAQKYYDYQIVNDTVENAVAELEKIIC